MSRIYLLWWCLFLINPTVPTSITADRPVSDLRVIGPIFGLVMPCCDRSPNIKYAAITRSLSTRFNGRRWASVIPKRINSFVITWICNHKTCHTSFEVCIIKIEFLLSRNKFLSCGSSSLSVVCVWYKTVHLFFYVKYFLLVITLKIASILLITILRVCVHASNENI